MGAQRLPPLNSLWAFEVAARHLSFKRAADELNITPTAVSHRIRILEDWLGLRLFNRLTRSLELTKEGEAYATRVHTGFEELIAASDSLRHSIDAGQLVVSATMSFASNWLSARLLNFYEQHDDFAVTIEASDTLRDFASTNIDVAIRFGEGGYEGLHSQMLFTDLVTPVCTPAVAKNLSNPSDLMSMQLIAYTWPGHADDDPSWARWFESVGVDTVDRVPITTLSEEHLALQQVLAGGGVAFIGTTSCGDALLDGRLVRPFPIAIENHSHYFTCRKSMLGRHKVRVFHDWLHDQATAFEESIRSDSRLRFDVIIPTRA